jgi:uncharacterized membrane protein (UPF0127 family)
MKRVTSWSAVALLSACAVFAAAAGKPLKALKRAPLTFAGGKTIRVDVVDTPLDRERGLMFRRSLPRDYGMLFAFPRLEPLTFWMKNTFVSLDMVYIGSDKRVTAVFERVKASTPKTTDEEVARVGADAQYVLELPAGAAKRYKVKTGQPVKFDVAIPQY